MGHSTRRGRKVQRMGSEAKACRDISALSPVAQRACRAFLRECEKEGLPVLITETYRSQVRQDYLYAQGRTRAGKVVTWTRNSRHTGRMAWDICKNVKGQEYSDNAFFSKCGAIAKRLGITWGGTWDTPDKPHFEVTKDWKGKGESEVVEKCKIIIDGKEHMVERILKDGTNYIKIRDVAEAIGYDVTSKGNVAVLTKK